MTQHRNPNLLLFLLFTAAILTVWRLQSNAPLQAAPAFQSGINTPTPTATSTLIPTSTPTAPPDISQSRKTVSHQLATVGDVLTYTVAITKTGPPARLLVWEWFEPTLGRFKAISHTQPADFSFSNDGLVWNTMTPPGPYTAAIVYRAQVMSLPPDGIVTNTANIFAFGGNRATRQAATALQTATPFATYTPHPTSTARPTATPVPTAPPTATPVPPVTAKQTAAPPTLPATPAPAEWQPPPNWPKYLPETGTR